MANDELREAAQKMMNEANAIAELARPSIGNTNVECLLTRVTELRAALAASREGAEPVGEVGEDGGCLGLVVYPGQTLVPGTKLYAHPVREGAEPAAMLAKHGRDLFVARLRESPWRQISQQRAVELLENAEESARLGDRA